DLRDLRWPVRVSAAGRRRRACSPFGALLETDQGTDAKLLRAASRETQVGRAGRPRMKGSDVTRLGSMVLALVGALAVVAPAAQQKRPAVKTPRLYIFDNGAI